MLEKKQFSLEPLKILILFSLIFFSTGIIHLAHEPCGSGDEDGLALVEGGHRGEEARRRLLRFLGHCRRSQQ